MGRLTGRSPRRRWAVLLDAMTDWSGRSCTPAHARGSGQEDPGPLGGSLPGSPQFVKVLKTEEKGSDVNIATHMIHDGHRGRYDLAVLVTNDSDLTEPVRIVTQELRLRVAVVNPHPRQASRSLIKYATTVRQIRPGLLAASQLPASLRDANGTIHKPPDW